ncbi:Glycerol-3-phosphate phosphatase [Aix galericulata]|nr:Glycerol-3-phosphate phosphatase [Aix galericulata]
MAALRPCRHNNGPAARRGSAGNGARRGGSALGRFREGGQGGAGGWGLRPPRPSVRAVLVGFDEHFSYAKLCQALRYLQRGPDCLLVATNRDHRLPLEGGAAIPGTGCLVKAVETAAEREAFIVGKPNRYMFDCVASEFDIDPARTIMVGDRLDTDILMGNTCGLTTLLTLTGVTTLEEVKGHEESDCPARQSLVPDYYVDSIADLLPALED